MPDTTSAEIKTFFTADVSGLSRGQREVKSSFDQLLADNRKSVSAFEQFTGTGGKASSMLEGLSGVLKGGTARWLALGSAAGAVATLAFNAVREEATRVREELELLTKETVRASTALSTMGRSSDIGALAAEFKAASSQWDAVQGMKAERERTDPLGRFKRWAHDRWIDSNRPPPGMFPGHPDEGSQTESEKQETKRVQDTAGAKGRLRESHDKLLAALGTQTRLAGLGSSGDTDAAKQLTLQLQMEREIADLQKGGAAGEEFAAEVRKKYALASGQIVRDRENINRFAQMEAGIQGDLAKGQSTIAEQNRLTLEYEQKITAAKLAGGAAAAPQIKALEDELQARREMLTMQQAFDRMRSESSLRTALFAATNASDTAKALQAARERVTMIEKELRTRTDLTKVQRDALEAEKAGAQAAEKRAIQAIGYKKTWGQVMTDLRKERDEKRQLDTFDRGQGQAIAKARRAMGLDDDGTGGGKREEPSPADKIRKQFGWGEGSPSADIRARWGWAQQPGVSSQGFQGWNDRGLADSGGLQTGGLTTSKLGDAATPVGIGSAMKKPEARLSAGQMLQKTADLQLKQLEIQTGHLAYLAENIQKVILA